MAEKIKKDMSFREVIQKHPETAEVFAKNNMHCIGCMAAAFETIEQGAEAHGIDPVKLVSELNQKITKKKD